MIILSALGLAFAIALGLGAKEIVAKFLIDSLKIDTKKQE
jgi:hypothetical protein